MVEQRIEGNLLAGVICTVSFEVGGTIYHGSGAFPVSNGTVPVEVDGYPDITFGCATGYMFVLIPATSNTSIKRFKCEMGFVSTLAYDAPMDYSKELLVCQYFAKKIEKASKVNFATTSVAVLQFLFPTMRIAPTITLPSNTDFLTASNVGSWTPAERIITDVTTSSAAIVCSGTFTGIHYGAVNNGAIFLSADL